MAETILRLPAVIAATGLSRSTIYTQIQNGEFPKQISLGQRAVGWLKSEIDIWVTQQTERSRATNHRPDGNPTFYRPVPRQTSAKKRS